MTIGFLTCRVARAFLMTLFVAATFAFPVAAQIVDPGMQQPVIPFPTAPPPPPPPSMAVPQVPQMNSPPKFELQNATPSRVEQGTPQQPRVRKQRREAFSDRVQRCLDQAAVAGYGPNERAAYSRSCATR